MSASSTRHFLHTLYDGKPEHDYILLWTYPEKRSHWFQSITGAAAFAEEHAGRDVYAGVGLSREDYGPSRRCRSDEIAGLAGMWADLDVRSAAHPKQTLPPTVEEALRILPDDCPPTMIVSTGNGAHAWWLFKEPWTFDSDDERSQAALLAARWQTMLKQNAARLGWTHDALSDLARVLRVPGTTNHKDPASPKPVEIHSNGGQRYNPSDIADYLDVAGVSAAPAPKAPIATGSMALRVDPSARIPKAMLEQWMAQDMRFRNTWLRQRHDIHDQTQSGYDLALANFGVDAGLTPQQIVDLIVHHRATGPGRKQEMRPEYFERTIGVAMRRKDAAMADPQAPPPAPVAPPAAAAVPSQADDSGQPVPIFTPEEKRQKILDRVSQCIGMRVLRLIKITGDEPTYLMELETTTIKFANVGKLIDQASVRLAIAAATNKLIRKVKPGEWEMVSQSMLDALIERDGGDENEAAGVAKMYLIRYLTENAFISTIDSQPIASAHNPTIIDGHVAVSASDLQMHVNKVFMTSLSVKAIAQMLTTIGARSVRIRGARLRDQSRWLLPQDVFDPSDFHQGGSHARGTAHQDGQPND